MAEDKLGLRELAHKLGPGLITGASDDDPSGILSYLQSGVMLGLNGLWVALVTLPLMYTIQEMCARLGLVTGKGLIKLIKENYSKAVLYPIAIISLVVISVNIGADLMAIGVVLEKLVGVSRLILIPLTAMAIILVIVMFSYHNFARVMKWLTLALFAYVAVAFYVHIDWVLALYHTVSPSLQFTKANGLLLAAMLGTTISPYLFFWQASEEVEERNEKRRESIFHRFVPNKHELKLMRADTFVGMLFSNLVMWFIIVSASQLKNLYGVTEITNFDQAARVLEPLLGHQAYFLFSLGIIGTGLLAIPVLAGSIGYILSEIFGWKEGINKKFHQAEGFYWAIIGATTVGCALTLLGLDPVNLLVYTAVAYTLITPPIIYFIIKLANNHDLMKHKINDRLDNLLAWAAFAAMLLAGIFFILS